MPRRMRRRVIFDEFTVAVALYTAADYGAVEHTERGEQSSSAMPLVVLCQGAAPSGLGFAPGRALQLLRGFHPLGRVPEPFTP
jgi:hypothetical protein